MEIQKAKEQAEIDKTRTESRENLANANKLRVDAEVAQVTAMRPQ